MSEIPPLSAISLYFIWSQSVEQLPPIWWFVSNQTNLNKLFLFKLSLGGCSVWVCQHLLRILDSSVCETCYHQCVQKKMNKVEGCCRHTLNVVAVFYSECNICHFLLTSNVLNICIYISCNISLQLIYLVHFHVNAVDFQCHFSVRNKFLSLKLGTCVNVCWTHFGGQNEKNNIIDDTSVREGHTPLPTEPNKSSRPLFIYSPAPSWRADFHYNIGLLS